MPRRQMNFRLPDLTRKELSWLCEHYGMTTSEVLMLAIDQLYHRNDEVNPISRDLGQTIVDMIRHDEATLDHE